MRVHLQFNLQFCHQEPKYNELLPASKQEQASKCQARASKQEPAQGSKSQQRMNEQRVGVVWAVKKYRLSPVSTAPWQVSR